ncbi:MAG: adenylosuccinate lyase [Bacteroidia bacterium]|nr:adenylosuccinate lyase [Bacteroidia bacterium]
MSNKNTTSLHAISPIDGRYHSKTQELSKYFSEAALIRYRLKIEIEYLIALAEIDLQNLSAFSDSQKKEIRNIADNLNDEGLIEIKKIEQTTNHDVKAVEYYLKEQLKNLKLDSAIEFVHFGLTSQDINNTASPLLLKDAMINCWLPAFNKVMNQLEKYAEEWKYISMLAKTHGQPASPTRLGKEFLVYLERLKGQQKQILQIPDSAKFGGATGNFNAHQVAYPKIDWINFANNFVEGLGLDRTTYTTQIEPYDNLAALFDALKRVNNILKDLSQDVWLYVSMGYFKQKIKEGEVGSSAMPHKVNPIDFENAEGNIGIANSLFEHLSSKLPVSRLQRDLTDSTVLRNVGVPLSHTLIALASISKGLDKLIPDKEAIHHDLDQNWLVISEAIQTVLRREGYPEPYEKLKKFTRGKTKVNKEDFHSFIDSLELKNGLSDELKEITPFNYIGIVPE